MSDITRFGDGRRADDREFRIIFWCAYPLFLAGAVAERIAPGRTAPRGARRSVFAEARAAAYRTIPYAF